MNTYLTTLIFSAMIAIVVSASMRIQGIQNREFIALFSRLEAQQKAQKKQMRRLWRSAGKLVEKPTPKELQKKRSLPEHRLDIMPLFSQKSHPVFEEIVFEISRMPRDLFDKFVHAARLTYEKKSNQLSLWDLATLSFEEPTWRASYFAYLKGKDSFLNRVKVARGDAKISIHQIKEELAYILFDKPDADRVMAKRKKLLIDPKEPLWNHGDLLALKTKRPEFRELITTQLELGADASFVEPFEVGSARVERLIHHLEETP